MKKVLSALVAATLISVTPLVMSDTADAQWGWRGGFHRFGYGYGGWGFRRLGWGGYGYGGYRGYAGYGGYGGYRGYRGYGGYGGCGGCGGAAVAVVPVVPVVLVPMSYGCGC
jgi:hypothetical protein